MGREELIWRMAKAAHDAHFCPVSGDHTQCTNCCEDKKCFELANGFNRKEEWEWWHTASGALEALERECNITFFPEDLPREGTSTPEIEKWAADTFAADSTK